MKFPALLALSASLALCLCSCGESYQKVAERHQPALEEFKADLEKIATEVASTGDSELPLSQALDPKPVFDDDNVVGSNIFITPIELLTDPNAKIDRKKNQALQFHFNDVKNLIIWAGWDQKANPDYEAKLQAAFQIRYVAVYQTLYLKEPSMIDEKTYDQGGAVVVVHVYDREADKVVCVFPVAAKAADTVSFNYDVSTSGTREGLDAASSSLWNNTREAFQEKLAKKAGVEMVD